MRKEIKRIFTVALLAWFSVCPAAMAKVHDPFEAPLIRGPGISQETLEAVASAEGRSTLSDYLDRARSEQKINARLRDLLERAQAAWLAGSLRSAKEHFHEITQLTLEADWLEPQREAIHYAHIRLAQIANGEDERHLWLKKSVLAFPDLHADPSLFPPPLMASLQRVRSDILTQAKTYTLYPQFSEARYLLVNGKRFVITPELRLRLPDASYRITLLSDFHRPVTEKLRRSQLDSFTAPLIAMASGNCSHPSGAELFAGLPHITVLYAVDCKRTRLQTSWLPNPSEVENELRAHTDTARSAPEFALSSPTQAKVVQSNHWLWIGLAALTASAALITYNELSKGHGKQPETIIRPIEREGF